MQPGTRVTSEWFTGEAVVTESVPTVNGAFCKVRLERGEERGEIRGPYHTLNLKVVEEPIDAA